MSPNQNPSSSLTPTGQSAPAADFSEHTKAGSVPFVASKQLPGIIAFMLLVVTFAAYWHVGECGFVTYDDPSYVFDEPMVNSGLRLASLIWVFSAPHSGNWHPLTSLSHMLDCSLFGLAPAPMHWENVLWHGLNAMLVFLVWRALTGTLWRSALVAALFALHPLRVESVAWISERKDVLCAFFGLVAIWFYAEYVKAIHSTSETIASKRRKRLLYAASLVAFPLGLMSKPMLVTLPFVLLLLDFWPLRRFPFFQSLAPEVLHEVPVDAGQARCRVTRLVLEKTPFLGLAAVFSVITFMVQRADGAMKFGGNLSFGARLANATVSYSRYLGKIFWPHPLAIFYPHSGEWPFATVMAAALLLVVLTAFALTQAKSRPWLLVGWLWFVGTLVPVLGLVQVGSQSMADRFTYIPALGLYTIFAWAAVEVCRRWTWTRSLFIGAFIGVPAICFWLTERQVLVWKDGITLFEHNLVSTEENTRSRLYLADALDMAGKPEAEVLQQCHRALEIEPGRVAALRILALMEISNIAAEHQHFDEAHSRLEEAHRLDPSNVGVVHALGAMALQQGNHDEAAARFAEALRLDTKHGPTHHDLAKLYFEQKRLEDCRAELQAAIEADRWDYIAYGNLGVVLKHLGREKESQDCFSRAIWINPRYGKETR